MAAIGKKNIYDFLVIGSGPSGVAAARVLLERGFVGKILDSGDLVPSSTAEKISQLSRIPFEQWTENERNIRANLSELGKNLKRHRGSKSVFGSNFVYTDTSDARLANQNIQNLTEIPISLAMGGFSNVWGATFFPLTNQELEDSLIKQEHYDYVSEFVPILGNKDDLSEFYALPKIYYPQDFVSDFALKIKQHALNQRDKLAENRVIFGLPRLALRTKTNRNDLGCQHCGLCASGCVYGSIWNSSHELTGLKKSHEDIYKSKFIASKIIEHENIAEVQSTNGEIFFAKKILVACGALSSTILLQNSDLINNAVVLMDTQVTLVPFFTFQRQKQKKLGFVLSQAFLSVTSEFDREIQLSVQLIGYNPDFTSRLRESYPIMKLAPEFLIREFSKYLGVALVYQRSEESGQIVIQKEKTQITIEQVTTNRKSLFLSEKWKPLAYSLKKLRLFPIPFFAQILDVGLSFHLGSLRKMDGTNAYDNLGVSDRAKNVHVVDGSALPDVFPGSITNTIMANAVRIATEIKIE